MEFSDYLGIQPRYLDGTDVGGSSFEFQVATADAAIAAGLCTTAVIAYANTPRQDRPIAQPARPDPTYIFRDTYERPTGLLSPDIGPYALATDRYMWEFGMTSEQLAEVAVASRQWASMNPKAFRYGHPLTIEDVLASPLICDPLHTADCCLVTDGGGAVVLTSHDRARDLRTEPVDVLGFGEAISHGKVSVSGDLIRTGSRVSGAAAFGMAGSVGRRRRDPDLRLVHDHCPAHPGRARVLR